MDDDLEQCIRALLTQNHGVGIIGGFYEPGLPLALISALTLDMLGYEIADALSERCGGSILPLFSPEMCIRDRCRRRTVCMSTSATPAAAICARR